MRLPPPFELQGRLCVLPGRLCVLQEALPCTLNHAQPHPAAQTSQGPLALPPTLPILTDPTPLPTNPLPNPPP